MYTIEDVDERWPELSLGEEYRDLCRHHYGRVASDITWSSFAEFKRDLAELRDMPLDGSDLEEDSDADYNMLGYEQENLLDEAGYDRRMNRYDEDEW